MWKRLSGWHTADNKYRIASIENIRSNNLIVKTFTFNDKACARAKPGQFLMFWLPGVDEIPLSILGASEDGKVSVAVKKVGEATEALHNMKESELVGIRGPFGNCFSANKGRVLMIGGGTGIAPLLFLARRLFSKVARVSFIIGAKTKTELLFLDELQSLLGKENVIATTEDGSCGVKGLCTKPLESVLAEEKFDVIYSCGPELMIRKIFDQAEKRGTPVEASLERLMRCAIGLCGSCVIGRYRVCRDGPIFKSEQLREIASEFGVSKRDFDGRKIQI